MQKRERTKLQQMQNMKQRKRKSRRNTRKRCLISFFFLLEESTLLVNQVGYLVKLGQDTEELDGGTAWWKKAAGSRLLEPTPSQVTPFGKLQAEIK